MNYKQVVTSFLTSDGLVLLLRRSNKVGTHRGKWSGVSGYLEGSEHPLTRAVTEIREELGLATDQIELVRGGELVRAFDEGSGTVWVIHPFLFKSKAQTIRLDWENTEHRWVKPHELSSYDTVPKLREALDRVQRDLQNAPESLTGILRKVKEIEEDRVHGASYLGRRAIELLSETAQDQAAEDTEVLFSQLLMISLQLRRAQPAMANLWNLTGRLLRLADSERNKLGKVEEFRESIQGVCRRLLEMVEQCSEEVSRTSVGLLPRDGSVLTHSYSSSVCRALELGFKGGRGFKVYVTESYPGMEGKQLAKDLIALGIPVTLIADSAVSSILPSVSFVLVGADGVLQDGSLIHKIGTRYVASESKRLGIPFYSSCETVKFSTQDFLGERPEISSSLFDLTPPEFVSGYITEEGELAPDAVAGRIVELQKEIYP